MFRELSAEQKGWYLSGFADGESYFFARPQFRTLLNGEKRTIFALRWAIQLRADDDEILKQIKEYLDSFNMGIGGLSYRKRKGTVSEHVNLAYDGVKQCGIIRKLFEEFPLQAKKRKDFEVWKHLFDMLDEEYRSHEKRTHHSYNNEQLMRRAYICHLCDALRVGRLDLNKLDEQEMGQLLKEQGGQDKLYVELFLEHHKNDLSPEDYQYIFSNYRNGYTTV